MRAPACRYGRLRPPYAHRRSRGNRLRVRAAVGTRALAAIVPPPSIPPLVRPSPEPLPLDIPHSIPSSSRPPTPSSLILQRADAIPPRTLRTSLPCKAPTIAIRGPSFVAPTRGRAPAFPGHAPPPRRAPAEARRVATPASLLLDGARSCEDGGLRASRAIPTARLVTAPNFSGARPPRRRRAPGPRPAFVRTQRARPAAGPALPPAARPLAANPKAVSPTPPPFPRRCDLAWRHMRGFIELCLLPSPPFSGFSATPLDVAGAPAGTAAALQAPVQQQRARPRCRQHPRRLPPAQVLMSAPQKPGLLLNAVPYGCTAARRADAAHTSGARDGARRGKRQTAKGGASRGGGGARGPIGSSRSRRVRLRVRLPRRALWRRAARRAARTAPSRLSGGAAPARATCLSGQACADAMPARPGRRLGFTCDRVWGLEFHYGKVRSVRSGRLQRVVRALPPSRLRCSSAARCGCGRGTARSVASGQVRAVHHTHPSVALVF